ncbi:hypothetical protein AX16_008872 [Volvariella volvacea WC 439]|nr:hypothetical protein AX16_008872 [Volvariella volvacea WC 439]
MIARSDILAALAQSPSFGERLALSLGLAKLPEHFHTLVLSFLFFTAIHLVVAPYLSRKWFPVAYGEKLRSRLAKNNWAIHVVSQVHTVIVVPLALWNIYKEPSGYIDNQEKAFGWTDSAGFLHAIACGYFLWDALDAVINFIDLGFVAHGISCLTIYLLSFRPFIAYYGRRCLLWETSTFFLNIHWFLDKTGRTGTTFQLVNGIALLASFFGVRIVYGGITSYYFYHTLREVHETVPLSYTLIYGLGNLLLQSLNWFWFTKMITALRKRFQPKVEELQPLLQAPIQNGIHPN